MQCRERTRYVSPYGALRGPKTRKQEKMTSLSVEVDEILPLG